MYAKIVFSFMFDQQESKFFAFDKIAKKAHI